jgi:hypothetical protein
VHHHPKILFLVADAQFKFFGSRKGFRLFKLPYQPVMQVFLESHIEKHPVCRMIEVPWNTTFIHHNDPLRHLQGNRFEKTFALCQRLHFALTAFNFSKQRRLPHIKLFNHDVERFGKLAHEIHFLVVIAQRYLLGLPGQMSQRSAQRFEGRRHFIVRRRLLAEQISSRQITGDIGGFTNTVVVIQQTLGKIPKAFRKAFGIQPGFGGIVDSIPQVIEKNLGYGVHRSSSYATVPLKRHALAPLAQQSTSRTLYFFPV